MTLEQASSEALAAALAGDLDALHAALEARAEAIIRLESRPETIARIKQGQRAGEEIAAAIFAFKQRIGFDSARLAQLQTGLNRGWGGSPTARLDFRG